MCIGRYNHQKGSAGGHSIKSRCHEINIAARNNVDDIEIEDGSGRYDQENGKDGAQSKHANGSFLSGNCRSKLLINCLVFAIGASLGRMTNWSSGMTDPKPSPVSSTEFQHYQFDEMHKHLYQIANIF